MKNPVTNSALILLSCALFNAQAFGERINLGEGLTIEQPSITEISYRPIPSYNASKKMLQRHSEDKLQYFINIDRLPRGSNNADRYFERLLSDVSETSTPDSFQIIDQGKYWTENNVQGMYVEYSFTPIGREVAQHQIAHFMTNTYRTYIAIGVLVDSNAKTQLHDESIALFRSASISTANTPMPKMESSAK